MSKSAQLKKTVEEFFDGEQPEVNIGKNPLQDPELVKKADKEIDEALGQLVTEQGKGEPAEFPQQKKLESLQLLRTKLYKEIGELAKQISQLISDKFAAKEDNKLSLASQIEDRQLKVQNQKDQKYVQWMRVKRQITQLKKDKKAFLNLKAK